MGKSQQTFLRFEFTDNVGRVVSGRTGGLSWRQQRLWSQDKAITVFFDPVNSSVFTVNPNVVGEKPGGEMKAIPYILEPRYETRRGRCWLISLGR